MGKRMGAGVLQEALRLKIKSNNRVLIFRSLSREQMDHAPWGGKPPEKLPLRPGHWWNSSPTRDQEKAVDNIIFEHSHTYFCFYFIIYLIKTQNNPGVPPVAQWVKNLTEAAQVAAEVWVSSPAWHSGLKDIASLHLRRRLQQQLRFSPWPGNFHVSQGQP